MKKNISTSNGLKDVNYHVGKIEFAPLTKTLPPLNKFDYLESNHSRLIYKHFDGESVSVDFNWDSDIYEVMEFVNRLLLGVGFHPNSVKDGFRYMADEFYGEATEDAE